MNIFMTEIYGIRLDVVFFQVVVIMPLFAAKESGINFFFSVPCGDYINCVNMTIALMQCIQGLGYNLGAEPGYSQ